MRVTPHPRTNTRTDPHHDADPGVAAPTDAARRRRPRRTVGRLAVLLVLTTAVVAVTPLAAQAAEPDQVVAIADSVDEVLGNIRNWLMSILAALATVFLTIGGVLYMMAAGDVGQVERAKTSFKAAGMGYALAALAPLVVQVLEGIVGT